MLRLATIFLILTAASSSIASPIKPIEPGETIKTGDYKTLDCKDPKNRKKCGLDKDLDKDHTPTPPPTNSKLSTTKVQFQTIRPARPDIIVKRIEATGSPMVNGNTVEVPIRVIVRNQGGAAASTFKISLEYTGTNTQGQTLHVGFSVPGNTSNHYPETTGYLSPNHDFTFSGKAVFYKSVHGVISLNAIADSCSGEEFMPSYCRINESNEENNKSTSLSIRLP